MRFFRKHLAVAFSNGRPLRKNYASGALFQKNRKRLIEHYDNLAPNYSKLYEEHSRIAHFYKTRKRCIYELMKDVSGGNLLEVGCGPGILVDFILNKSIQYFAVDISGGMIKVCKETFSDTVTAHFVVGDSQYLPFSEGLFEIVLCIGMLEYVQNEESVIKELVRVLRPAGIFIISGINKWSPYNAWNRLVYRPLRRRYPVGIIHEYHSENEYRKLLLREKLTVLDVVYFDFNLFLSPFDRYFTNSAISTSDKLESYCRGQLKGLGNGFILKCIKKD